MNSRIEQSSWQLKKFMERLTNGNKRCTSFTGAFDSYFASTPMLFASTAFSTSFLVQTTCSTLLLDPISSVLVAVVSDEPIIASATSVPAETPDSTAPLRVAVAM